MKQFREDSSQEVLNALADRQYSPDEQAEKLRQVRRDASAAQELCALRDLKDSLRAAYSQVSPPARLQLHQRPRHRLSAALAAGVLLLIGGVASLWMQPPVPSSAQQVQGLALLDPAGRGARSALAHTQEARVVFHVATLRETTPGDLLDEVESLLLEYRRRGQPVRVEVVAHGAGLDLLRAGLSREAPRLHRMASAYPGLTFVACGNTIRRLKVEQGIEVVLLPEATMTESGIAHVVRRQAEGWAYIQV